MKNFVTLINPNIVTQKGDYFGSGIPYWPITLAYIAGLLKKYKIKYEIIDMFGEKPKQAWQEGRQFKNGIDKGISCNIIQGLELEDIHINTKSKYIIICPNTVFSHERTLDIICYLKTKYPNKKIVIVQNIHNVVAYNINIVKKEFYYVGADKVVVGEPENQIAKILKKKKVNVLELIPDWSKFPLENYWKLGYAHAPYKGRYMPIITSRGCPGKCNFCISPSINKSKWRPRSSDNVIKEIINYKEKYKINEIHISDLNPTWDKKRIKSIFWGVTDKIQFKFTTGIKLESIDSTTLYCIKEDGCAYLSFSPESGSKRILKKMNKSFDFEHGIKMTMLMHKLRITSQACFVIGYPGETEDDRLKTRDYIRSLTKSGIDEIALFIFTPLPGAKVYIGKGDYTNLSDLTFSPKWRKEYQELNKWRWKTYIWFFIWKLNYHPFSYLNFKNTKIYNTIKRVLNIRRLLKC